MDKNMVQHYPAEDNRYRSGSALQLLNKLATKAKRQGIAQNLNMRGSQVARFIVERGRVTAILQPSFLEALLKEADSVIKKGSRRERSLSGEVDNLSGELSNHQQLEQDIADSKRIAVQRYNDYPKSSSLERGFGNTPRIYRCLDCQLYFATAGTRSRVKCQYCSSDKVKRVK